MTVADLDAARLVFDARDLDAMRLVLAFIMFGVALDLRLQDFRDLAEAPKAPLVGLVAQFVLLPAAAFALIGAMNLAPSLALGMLLVAACPGGNVSNFLTHLARGRVATSVGMTAVSTTAATVMTPLNLRLWGGLDDGIAARLNDVALDPLAMLTSLALLLLAPLAAGMACAAYLPRLAARLRRPAKILSVLCFLMFVAMAFRKNVDLFLAFAGMLFVPVAVMHAASFALAYGTARAAGLEAADRRAVSLEVAIQNTGLGLVLAFAHFDGLGAVAAVCAFWGLWHIVAGLAIAGLWSRVPPHPLTPPPEPS